MAREARLSLSKILQTWCSTVLGARVNALAMAELLMPRTSRWNTSRWRPVRLR